MFRLCAGAVRPVSHATAAASQPSGLRCSLAAVSAAAAVRSRPASALRRLRLASSDASARMPLSQPRCAVHYAAAALFANESAAAAAHSATASSAPPSADPPPPPSPPPLAFDQLVASPAAFDAFLDRLRSPAAFLPPGGPVASQRTMVVALSGGVDSAMVLSLMVRSAAFKRVVAVHMTNWDEIDERGACTGEKDLLDAQAVADSLGVEFERVDYTREYFLDVFQPLIAAYSRGETPSPDVMCNRIVKFDLLLEHVRRRYGEDALLATGHYSRLKHTSDGSCELHAALDAKKDQSYFLSSVPATALRRCIFPLGQWTKAFLKSVAASPEWTAAAIAPEAPAAVARLPLRSAPLPGLSRKKESMGICFIGKRSMQSFLGDYLTLRPGAFVDVDTGAVVGRHLGWEAFTVGQKAAIASQKQKLYVCGKLASHVEGIVRTNSADCPSAPSLRADGATIFVCATRDHPALYSDELHLEAVRWISGHPPAESTAASSVSPSSPLAVRVKIRSTAVPVSALLHPLADVSGTHRVVFSEPQFAIAAGQTCVVYDADDEACCLGEGRIVRAGASLAQQQRTRNAQPAAAAAASAS